MGLQERLTLNSLFQYCSGDAETQCVTIFMLAFIPLLFVIGIFLGILVVVGQSSKQGYMEKFTAVMLLLDVLFKVVATAVTEAIDYALHVRVRRAVARGTSGGSNLGPAP